MKILSISVGHDSSLCILEDGQITYYSMEERLSRKKHDWTCYKSILKLIHENKTDFDFIVISYINYLPEKKCVKQMIKCFQETGDFTYKKIIVNEYDHHLYHAYCGFYNSKFKQALCFVVDGSGSYNDPTISFLNKKYKEFLFKETESIFLFKESKQVEKIYTHYYPTPLKLTNKYAWENLTHDKVIPSYKNSIIEVSSTISVGWQFEKTATQFGFDWTDAGKVMGLAQYKNFENELKNPYNTDSWIQNVNTAYEIQKETQEKVLNLIKKYTKETGINNVVISGGYGLNCVSNNFYKEKIPNINLHIDPICFDAGISIGAAYKIFEESNQNNFKRIRPLKNAYIGHHESDYHKKLLGRYYFKCSYQDVIDLLVDGNSVAIFQGKSEAGQRALGNRSILFDPRIENGRDIVNQIKKRENFRPFAGSILEEHFEKWFETNGLKTSKYMQYAVKVNDKFIDKIPSVLHVDGTCRVQTVSKKDNLHFYNLIKCFHKKTKIPLLLNTSFNLAGDPLVETIEDALFTLENSKIEYLYIPDIQSIVYQKN